MMGIILLTLCTVLMHVSYFALLSYTFAVYEGRP